MLSLDEMTERLREATAHYAKYSHVVAVHTECNMKAARFLAAHEVPWNLTVACQNGHREHDPLPDLERL